MEASSPQPAYSKEVAPISEVGLEVNPAQHELNAGNPPINNSEAYQSTGKDPRNLPLTRSNILYLQRTIGNKKVLRKLASNSKLPQPTSPIVVARKLKGLSEALAETPQFNFQWGVLIRQLRDYEQAEDAQVTLLAQITTAENALPQNTRGRTAMMGTTRGGGPTANLPALIEQKKTGFENLKTSLQLILTSASKLLIQEGIPQAAQEKLETLIPRLKREMADLYQGRFSETTGFSDATLTMSNDNAVGGALNKLDSTRHGNFEGFYKPETIKDIKYDHHAGTDTGIPENNPNFGGRSVAMYRLDQLLNANVIVRTEFATHRRQGLDANNQPLGPGPLMTMGILMEKAPGVEMRRGVTDMQRGEGLAYSGAEQQQLRNQGQVRINVADPVLQRGLNKLQILDALCAQVDRHNANYYITKDAATGAVTGVKGIDNDLSFGKNMKDPSKWKTAESFKNLPPLVDAELGQALLNIEPNLVAQALEGLLDPAEIASTLDRLKVLKDHLQVLQANNKFLAPGQWDEETARAQNRENSYLGQVKAEGSNKLYKELTDILTRAGLADKSDRRYFEDVLGQLVTGGRMSQQEAYRIADYAAKDFVDRIEAIRANYTTKRTNFVGDSSAMTRLNQEEAREVQELANSCLFTYLSGDPNWVAALQGKAN